MQLHELTWLAAAIDGEGSIYYRKISIYNTNHDFCKKAQEITGLGYVHCDGLNRISRRPLYVWSVYGRKEICDLLNLLIPFLIIKKEKALKIISQINQMTSITLSESAQKRWLNPEYRNKIILLQRQRNRLRDENGRYT